MWVQQDPIKAKRTSIYTLLDYIECFIGVYFNILFNSFYPPRTLRSIFTMKFLYTPKAFVIN